MKKVKKMVLSILCLAMLVVGLTGCEKTSSQIENESLKAIRSENIATITEMTETLAETMKGSSLEKAKEYYTADYEEKGEALPVFYNDWFYRWGQFEGAHGLVKEAAIQEDGVERDGEEFVSRVILTGEDEGQMMISFKFDKSGNGYATAIQDYADDSQETLGNKLATAGGNTITGLLVVFTILIGLSLIIASFKFIGKAGGEVKPEKKDAPKASPAAAKAAPAERAAAPAPAEDPSKDQELIAVIAAAIAASEGKPVEGYRVRSIRRLGSNKWR